ncbi:ssDNA-binding protein [Ochrobactrum sp. WV_118_8]
MAEKKKDPARVQLKNVRLSYAHIYKAKGFAGGNGDDKSEPKFSANALLDPETREGKVNIEKMEDAIDYVIGEHKWSGGKTPKFPEAKLPLRDGENQDSDGYDGMMYVSASNAKKPRILDRDKLDVQEGDDEAPYSGCYVDMIVRVWAQDNKFGKRINASLEGIRFRDDGDAFGAAPLDPDEFDDDDDDDRGSRRDKSSRSRDKDDDDRGSRGGRGGRSRDKDDDDGDDRRSSRRGRAKDDDDDGDDRRSSRRGRSKDDDDGDDRRSSRGRSKDDDDDGDDRRSNRRGRSRDDDDDGDDRRGGRSRGRDDDDDDGGRDERRSRRSRDDDDRGSRRGGGRRSRDDDDLA